MNFNRKCEMPIRSTGFYGVVLLAAAILTSHLPSAQAQFQAPPWPVTLRSSLMRLADMQWRMQTAAGQQCPRISAASGLTVDSINAYGEDDRALVRHSLNMNDMPQIAGVVKGSPAAAAGLTAGDAILSVNGIDVRKIERELPNRTLLADKIEKSISDIPENSMARLTIKRGESVQNFAFQPLQQCSVRFVLKTESSVDAYSDGADVAVTTGLMYFTHNDDELALILGHEMGHVLHRDGKAKTLAARRTMEDRADIAGAVLAKCAGYDVETALDFWERFRKRDWLKFLRDPTHRSVKDRIELIRASIPTLQCSQSVR